jgi:hypothetical protein
VTGVLMASTWCDVGMLDKEEEEEEEEEE